MYALDAKTGKIVWEFYLVPKTEGDLLSRATGRVAARHVDMEECSGDPDHGRRNVDVLHVGPRHGPALRARRQSRPRFRAPAVREGENLYTGSVVVLDAKTGAYKNHFKLVPKDWHDWDVSNTPALIHTQGGKRLMAVAPKDGHLYGIDLATNAAALPHAGDENRECRRPVRGGQARPFLPRLRAAAQNGTARPTIRRPTSF